MYLFHIFPILSVIHHNQEIIRIETYIILKSSTGHSQNNASQEKILPKLSLFLVFDNWTPGIYRNEENYKCKHWNKLE